VCHAADMNTRNPESTQPSRIEPDAIYRDGDVRLILDLPSATLARARREGRLKYSRQGGRLLYRGAWILDWIERDASKNGGDR